jgi:hypothetical protein
MSTFERLPKENRDRRYRQRMFIGNIDETRTITFGRDVHGPARIDARYHDEGAPFDPSLAARIDVIDHLRNLAWNIWPKDRFGLGGTRNPQLGLIHLGSRGGAIYSPGTFGCGTNAKLPTASSNVRVRGLSGSLLLAARFSQFDPHEHFCASVSSFGDPRYAHAFIDALALGKIGRIVSRCAGADARNGEGRK